MELVENPDHIEVSDVSDVSDVSEDFMDFIGESMGEALER